MAPRLPPYDELPLREHRKRAAAGEGGPIELSSSGLERLLAKKKAKEEEAQRAADLAMEELKEEEDREAEARSKGAKQKAPTKEKDDDDAEEEEEEPQTGVESSQAD